MTGIRKHIFPIFVLSASLVAFNYVWDIIVTGKIYAFNSRFSANVLDLGIFYYRAWAVGHLFNDSFFQNIEISPIVFLFGPLSYSTNILLFPYLQTLWISLSSVPMYFIAYSRLSSKSQALAVSASYLLFFGTAGILWFDVHYQSLFIPLFITGYALMLYEKKKTAVFFLVLSGLVRFPYEILPILFSLATLIENFGSGKRKFSDNSLSIMVLAASSTFFLIGIIALFPNGTQAAFLSNVHSTDPGFMQNLTSAVDSKIFTVFLMLGPFMFLPLLKPKWTLMLTPYLFLLFFSGYSAYYFPDILQVQYWSLVIPFLFIGTVECISSIHETGDSERMDLTLSFRHMRSIFSRRSRIILTIFLIIILLGTVYQPYGPLNRYSSSDFTLSGEMNYNKSFYSAYVNIVNLIPQDTPYVLYQNNMPEVVYHDPPSGGSFYGFGFPGNFTYYIGGKWVDHPEYIIADPYSRWFSNSGSGGTNITMYDTLRHFLSNPDYGVVAEYDGLILIEYHYKGSPIIYSPENRLYTGGDLTVLQQNYAQNGVISGANLTSDETLWYGPYAFMQPGSYTLKLQMKSANISTNNSFTLRFSYYPQTGGSNFQVLDAYRITGANFTAENEWINFTFNIHTNNFLDSVEFAGVNFVWNGNISLQSISLFQTGYD